MAFYPPASIENRPFPDENTVAEMYCNEAFIVDNETVEDWTSSLHMLLTFVSFNEGRVNSFPPDSPVQAAIFSAVIVTLIVDSKALLEQNQTEVAVDVLIFFMNNQATGTPKTYSRERFKPSVRSILVNCFFFASLCLSIATALATVLCLQWVTDYAAVTRRAGATPEERVKQRHFRYQGGQAWKMDGIIGTLPVLLHISVMLFFTGLILWMWGIHHFIFGISVVCGVTVVLFYISTTAFAVLYPSCPYRTPLASWTYSLIRLFVIGLSRLTLLISWKPRKKGSRRCSVAATEGKVKKMEEGETIAGVDDTPVSKYHHPVTGMQPRFTQPSLAARDRAYARNLDPNLMMNSLVWLSNCISISPEIYSRLSLIVNGLASEISKFPDTRMRTAVPWIKIFHTLGTKYVSLLCDSNASEASFLEFARLAEASNRLDLNEIIKGELATDEDRPVLVGSPDFPLRLLCSWVSSFPWDLPESRIEQRISEELTILDLVQSVVSTPQEFYEMWYTLLNDERTACLELLPRLLRNVRSSPRDKIQQRLDIILYIITTGHLPWDSTVRLHSGEWADLDLSPSLLTRRLQILDWVRGLDNHPHKQMIVSELHILQQSHRIRPLLIGTDMITEDEMVKLKLMGLWGTARWNQKENTLFRILVSFDRILANIEDEDEVKRLCEDMILMLGHDLYALRISFDINCLGKDKLAKLQYLSNPVLRFISCVTFGIEWRQEWSPDLAAFLEDFQESDIWRLVSKLCLRDPPYSDWGNIWKLRLQTWAYLNGKLTSSYLIKALHDWELLKRVEEGVLSAYPDSRGAQDFFLAFIHRNLAYEWRNSHLGTFIPDLLIGNTANRLVRSDTLPKECIDHLTTICREISGDTERLLQLLIELIQADINFDSDDRRPENLFNLLKHAKRYLALKDLRPFARSCSRLVQYTNTSYKLFQASWRRDSPPEEEAVESSEEVNWLELRLLYKEVIILLTPTVPRDEAEDVDAACPGSFLPHIGAAENDDEDEKSIYSDFAGESYLR
ncbi:hypothetical protein FRC17_008676 [Serendipita sp. 399]|nr:hypothetical protein FRC17_008676 [Serendipita sp. 399]